MRVPKFIEFARKGFIIIRSSLAEGFTVWLQGSKIEGIGTATISDLNQVTFVTFVPQEIATLYANTEDVKIRYQTAKGQSEEIPGNVTFVSESPADPDSILDIVGGQDRLSLLTEGDELPLHQVTVTPQSDSTVTGEQLPSVGQVVTLFNRYADPHPIDLLFGDE